MTAGSLLINQWNATQLFKNIKCRSITGNPNLVGNSQNDGMYFEEGEIRFKINGNTFLALADGEIRVNDINQSMDFVVFSQASVRHFSVAAAGNGYIRVGNNSLDPASTLFKVLGLDDRIVAAIIGHTTQTNPLLRLVQNDGASGVLLLDVDNEGVLTLVEQASDPAAPAAGYRLIYAKADGIYMRNSAGDITALATDA